MDPCKQKVQEILIKQSTGQKTPHNVSYTITQNLVFHPFFENSQDWCPLECDSSKVATKHENVISAIAMATKAVWNNRMERAVHTQPIIGLNVLSSHTVFSYSPVLLVSKKHNTPRQRKHSKTWRWKATHARRSDVATPFSAPRSSRQGFPTWAGGMPFQGFLLPSSDSLQYCETGSKGFSLLHRSLVGGSRVWGFDQVQRSDCSHMLGNNWKSLVSNSNYALLKSLSKVLIGIPAWALVCEAMHEDREQLTKERDYSFPEDFSPWPCASSCPPPIERGAWLTPRR